MQKPLDILIIEDVPADAAAIEAELREAGIAFTTRQIETREAFAEELDRQRPDIDLFARTRLHFRRLSHRSCKVT